jgi:hypothetical protein
MKKKAIITLLSLSLILSVLILIRINFIKGIRTWESHVFGVLIVIVAVALLVVAYRTLLKRLQKGKVDQKKYALLFDLENNRVSGEVEFYFTVEENKPVRFVILDSNMQEIKEVVSKNFDKGGHIVRFDVSTLTPGVYFYSIVTDNQRSMKKIFVQHDNLTA